MLMKEKIAKLVMDTVAELGIEATDQSKSKISITYPESKLGDYATNAALILAKEAKVKPLDLAKQIAQNFDASQFEKVEAVAPGFINFRLKTESLLTTNYSLPTTAEGKILVEYFQPNIAKPMHMGLMRTAVIGDAISRILKFLGHNVESDTHMGDWGTQFGFLILAKKKFGKVSNEGYTQLNAEAEKDESIREAAKQEFVKLEVDDKENRKIWEELVESSMKEFLKINNLMDIQSFDHHWPESFYEDKMPKILTDLKAKGLLKESQGAQIVDLENQGLGVALIVKSDGGTTYLLRDLATFAYRKSLGFSKQLYVVDVRQAHAFKQLFAILKMLGLMKNGEAEHIDYGFMSFKGEALSTRKGNIVLAEDVISQTEEKVAKIIAEKNPDLKNKEHVIDAVAKGALKYFDLKHNRHSDIEFDWDEVLDFEGDSGPYLQYAYARLSSILRKAEFPISPATLLKPKEAGSRHPRRDNFQFPMNVSMTNTEREILFKSSILAEIVEDSVKEYLPNVLANYLFNFATLLNKFYHESPVMQEKDENVRNFRLALIASAKDTFGKGLSLLGIEALEEM